MGEAEVVKGIILIFVGCMVNYISLEMIVKKDEGAGTLITVCQFLFIAIEGLIVHLKISRSGPQNSPSITLRKRVIPLRTYVVMVAIFWSLSVINNAALGFQIAMPLHMVFRSGSLITTVLLGKFLFKNNYTRNQVSGVISVTLGILGHLFLGTIATAT
eukprot:TRINITY_DN16331_c0_g1_i1.p2 TRINITY_DN16331_c0_g1~~TRINITY_DN16331_c0_g1_i1.p2  ORF type:complete len:159 (-),score=10.56 TRINITY_DN16331_c0_g1_i1:662-1138(-)